MDQVELIGKRVCAVCGGAVVTGVITGITGERITIDGVFVARWQSVMLLQ